MKHSWTWGLTLVLLVTLAALAGSCAAAGNKADGGTGGGGLSSGSGAGTGGTGGVPIKPGNDGGPVLGDGAPDANQGSGGGPPSSCDPASCQAAGGKCSNKTCVIGENPGGVDPATQAKLKAGGSADPTFAFLYPYDHTIFPRGLLPPTLQFGGAPYDAAYVHVTFPGLDYEGFYGAANPGRLVFSKAVWDAVALASTGSKDAVKVEVTKSSVGAITGPITESWTIAPGSLKGTIYYETYGSTILGGALSVGIMQIQPGASTPTVIKSGCGNVCHTASADGSTLVAATSLFGSASYDLKTNVSTIYNEPSDAFVYGALYPDGSFLMAATHFRTWLQNPSRLYDSKTGATVPASGWDGVITNGGTPAFAPDGKMMAFIHEDLDQGAGHTLAVMDFDVTKMQFSHGRDVAHDPAYTLGWPAFTPDSKSVVYHAGTSPAFETDSNAAGDLFYVDLATHAVARLDSADGYEGAKVYLPASDPHLNFAPTVLPEAVGGYFWVVFTSHRSYGNLLPSMDNADQNGKLWVAAFDLNPTPGKDASHPAFFLDGQETGADNLRGFWVLNPCKANADDCASGDDCCGGFCRSVDGGPLQCVPPPGGCSNEFETCKTAADCCNPGYECINSHCAQPPLK